MPYPRPPLTTLRQQAMQDVVASDLPRADGFLRRSALRVLAWVQAGLAHLHFGYLDWIARMAVPYTAEDEFLEGWAALAPTPVLRKAPQAATGPAAVFPGVAGTILPLGTPMQRGDGVRYVTTAQATVGGGATVSAPIAAVVPGSAGNADAGTPLTLTLTIAGITTAGSAGAVITGGTELEANDALRARMLQSYAAPPAGGKESDYVTWALAVPGVTRAWCKRNGMGAGTAVVYVMLDVAQAAYAGFPQGGNGVAGSETRDTLATGDQLAVANAIWPLQPVTALVYAVAPVAQPQAFTLTGLGSTTTTQRAAIAAALDQLLITKGSPKADLAINQSDVDAAIGAVPGLPAFAVTAPSVWPVTPAAGSLLTRGVVTYA
jgi:uncharacterized phage protein gp47/JayE